MSAPRSRWAAALVAAGLSLLFTVLYGTTNWFTTLRADVPSFYFEWERHLPFVPWMIVFYLSIDFFFVAAPFLTKTERELSTLAWRIATAIVLACICFLLFPLKFGFERPHAEGMLGFIFDRFRMLDPPFNECPSLHIALGMILGDTFLRNTRGIVRGIISTWLLLLVASPLLVYQHHVIDIAGGFLLGVLCLHLIQDEPLRQPFTPNLRVGGYYALGTALLAMAAFVWRPWTLVLLWPVLSLLLVTLAYTVLGPGIYRKEQGRLPMTTWVLLWPVLLGQRLSLLYYARRCNPCDRVNGNVIIGRQLSSAEARRYAAEVTAVLDLTCEFSEARSFRSRAYLQLPILDLTAPTPADVERAVAYISEQSKRGVVYVHCKIGFSRTAAIVGAYLLAEGIADSPEAAVALLRAARPGIIVRPEAMRSLCAKSAAFTPA